jgi:uncharacterized membrane protein YbaN (DUF454 family)
LRLTRRVYLALGFIFIALGFVGVFLPVLPTTPFLIIATACFARSSPRLENWLLSHSRFGPAQHVAGARRDPSESETAGACWRKRRILTGSEVRLGPILMASVGTIMLAGLAYVFTRPSP